MKNNDYVYGTLAKQIQYDVYEENEVLKEKKKYRLNRITKFKAVVSILLIFALGFIVAYRYALITDLNYKISKLEREYENLRDENSRLKVAVEKDTDLPRIKEAAEKKLGMQKPDKYQIVYIRVPKSNFTVTSETYKNSIKNNNLLAVILTKVDIIKKLFD
ncbi:MAG: cell division protein FtsL [Firmicutes bacterium]|nr:cell division protein FtsL [Bacillota bacterium]